MAAAAARHAFRIDRTALRRWASQTLVALPLGMTVQLLSGCMVVLLGLGQTAVDANSYTERNANTVSFVLNMLLIAPFLETALMGWLLLLLLDTRLNYLAALLVSASLWAALHQMQSLVGWVTFFPFLVYSHVFIERRRGPSADGFVVASMTHFYANASSTIAGFAGGTMTWHTSISPLP
jgi:membrane protease YdiL (CAAX protease family)